MHYYKVIKNQNVIDIYSGDKFRYVKYQPKHKVLLLCNITEAMGFLSDSGKCYHLNSLLPFPNDLYPTVEIVEITEIEYEQLKKNSLMTSDEIREDLLAELMERGML